MIFSILPSVPKEFSLAISPFLQIVSKAFEKSMKQAYNFLFLWNCLSINVFRTNMLSEVLINLLRHDLRLIPL